MRASRVTWKASRYDDGELRLIVEHFLEVRDVPELIHRVAVEAAAEMIVHAAVGHLAQREQRHAERDLAVACESAPSRAAMRKRKFSATGRGNFGAPPKPPSSSSKVRDELLEAPR